MRFAIQNSWPNLADNAEREFIERFIIASAHQGIETIPTITSDDIENIKPDLVIITHEFGRKLTQYPTIGLIWSPLTFYANDKYRMKSLLSYDGYAVGNDTIRRFIGDITAAVTNKKPVSTDIFLPTTYRTDVLCLESIESPSICYAGIHWDGDRHGDLFTELGRQGLCTFYGPPASWMHIPEAFGGMLPFDGKSVMEAIARHGLALCLHKREHRLQNTPSMRLFEALSVGALPICDDIPFAKDNLSDFAFFLDYSAQRRSVAEQLSEIVDYCRTHPEEVRDRGRRGKLWFDAHWSLDTKIPSCILPLLENVRVAAKIRSAGGAKALAPAPARTSNRPEPAVRWPFSARTAAGTAKVPSCEIIIRCGSRPMSFLHRALQSVQDANSSEFPLGVVLVDFKGRDDIKDLSVSNVYSLPIRYIRSKPTGFRSTALWDGIQSVEAEYVAHLDDDDTVLPPHYRQLHAAFTRNHHATVAYSGVIRMEDDEDTYFQEPNHHGPLAQVIPERRQLYFLDHYDLTRMAKFDNFIQSNTWMCRSAFLKEICGDDPELEVVEDVYLYLLMSQRSPFVFTGSATAIWHWRSLGGDNSMNSVDQQKWANCISRVKTRLANYTFYGTSSFKALSAHSSIGEDGFESSDHGGEPLPLGHAVTGGSKMVDYISTSGFHPGEAPGLWTKIKDAKFTLLLDERAAKSARSLVLEGMGASSGLPDQFVEFQVEGGESIHIDVKDWSRFQICLPIPEGHSEKLVVNVRSSHIVREPNGERNLGVFLSSIRAIEQKTLEEMKANELKPIRFGVVVEGGFDLADYTIGAGFYSPEEPGLWSRSLTASLTIRLATVAARKARFVALTAMASHVVGLDKTIEFSVDDGPSVVVHVDGWQFYSLLAPIPEHHGGDIVLHVKTSHLCDNGVDGRLLGVMIKSLQLSEAEE